MKTAEEIAKKFDANRAREYMREAKKTGKDENDGLSDYLEKELGIRRREKTDEVLKEVAEIQKRSTEKFINGLFQAIPLAADAAASPALLPIAFKLAGSHVDALIDKIESSADPDLKSAQKWLKIHKDDLMAELQY